MSAIVFGAAAGVLFLILYQEFERILVNRKIEKMQIKQHEEYVAAAREASGRAHQTCTPMSLVAGSFGKNAPGRIIDRRK